ncbi:MAG: hypothetical protein WBA29_04025 [Xanthobacteraceae bacterium]
MDSILDGSLADDIADALDSAGIPFAAIVVSRDIPQDSPDPADPLPPISTDFACKGFIDEWDADYITSTLVERSDVKIVIIANSIAIVPVAGDRVTVRAKSYSVLNVSADPALATYTLQARA